MTAWCKQIAGNRVFQNFISLVIIINAIMLGIETSRELMARYGDFFHALNWLFKAIFLIELVIRFAAYGRRPLAFFRDGWNVFDFVIVAVSMLPINGEYANVGRLLRLLRVLRLVSISAELRLIVTTMLTSIPSMGHVVSLAGLLLYIYGVIGCYLFRDVDPEHWGTLGQSVLTLFQVMTLEGWADIQKTLLAEKPFAWIYFASFIVMGVFVVINLFIAVVINNLEQAREKHQRELDAAGPHAQVLDQIENLKSQLNQLEASLRKK